VTKRLLVGIAIVALLAVGLPGCGGDEGPKVQSGGASNVGPIGASTGKSGNKPQRLAPAD